MKLSSKPKPVRIRISLGGIEHTTLESLKQNITPEILDFTDGRLLRWLERQNEVVVLDKIKKITNSNDKEDNANLLELYNALLNAHKKNLLDFIYEWGNDDNRSKDLAKYILETNLDAFPGLIDYHFHLFQPKEWAEILLSHNDSESEFKLAKKCDEICEFLVAERLLLRIKERGDCFEADNFYAKNYAQKHRLFSMNTEEELREIVNDWSKYCNLKIVINCEYHIKEQNIIDFIRACNECFPSDEMGKIISSFRLKTESAECFPINEFVDSDFLVDEKRAIIAMINYYHNQISDKRYGKNNAISSFMKEINKITDRFKLRAKVLPYNDIENIKKVVKEIIEYILFEKFQ